MSAPARAARALWRQGAWAPLAIFLLHVVLDRGLDAYAAWPHADMLMHFLGGVAMAFFLSRMVRPLLPPVLGSRAAFLEIALAGSLTVTVAVLWEFAEFALDHTVGSSLQVSLANTMQDLAIGILGAVTCLAIRARRLGVGLSVLRESVRAWLAA